MSAPVQRGSIDRSSCASATKARLDELRTLAESAHIQTELNAARREIDEVNTPVAAVLHDRNTHAPVSCLPPEVFCKIFASCALIERPWTRVGRTRVQGFEVLGWIKATHVCRLWRQVALGDASLWADIPAGMTANWMKESVLRASTSPITLDLHCNAVFSYPTAGIMWDVLSSCLPRIKCLTLRGTPDNIATVLRHYFSSPGPALALQSIEISPPDDAWFRFTNDHHILQLTDPHALTRLILNNCSLSTLDIPCFPNLLHFEINHCIRVEHNRPSGTTPDSWIVRTLVQMPRLETLVLRYTATPSDHIRCAKESQHCHQSPAVVHLPHLRNLHIACTTGRCLRGLMNSILVPPTATVQCEVSRTQSQSSADQ